MEGPVIWSGRRRWGKIVLLKCNGERYGSILGMEVVTEQMGIMNIKDVEQNTELCT